jgi:Cu2+-exporting ATPase
MTLTTLAIAGGAAVFIRVYQTHEKKKKTPWTVYAEKMAKKKKTPWTIYVEKMAKKKRELFEGGARQLQLKEMSFIDEARELTPKEKKARRNMAVVSVTLALSGGGALLSSPFLSLISVPLNLYLVTPIFKNAYQMTREKKVGVDTLSVIVIAAIIFDKEFLVFSLANLSYSLSRYLLIKIQDKSSSQLIDVFKQQPRLVWVVVDGVEVQIPFEQLTTNDIAVVQAGGVIPADGIITEGVASIDQHILTGESQPADKGVSEEVFASTIVLSGRICIEVKKAGQETTAARIGQILNSTVDFKSNTQLQAEIITDKTIWPMLIATGALFPFLGPGSAGAFLNTHFKYRMSIIAPIGIMNYLSVMSQHQILIKDGRTLDLLSQVDTLVFDKTGTLTEEQPHVAQIHTCSEYNSTQILTLAAAAESKQTHPIAKAITQKAGECHLTIPPIDNSEYKLGYGLTVNIYSEIVRVGSARFIEMENIPIPESIRQIQQEGQSQGHSLVMVARGDNLIGAIELHATLRPEAKEIISKLKQRSNIKSMYIISGDHEGPTRKLAQELGIAHYYAETLPEDKARIIEELQSAGRFVCYLGDGINDSIALKKAQVSISLRGASTVATDTAQIILMDQSLNQLIRLFEFGDEFKQNMTIGFMILSGTTIFGMSGVFLLHFGLLHTIFLGHAAVIAGLLNAITPIFKYKQIENKASQDVNMALNEVTRVPSLTKAI